MALGPESVRPLPSIHQGCRMLLGFLSQKGTASFADIDTFINAKDLRFFETPLFINGKSAAKEDQHPLVEYLMQLEVIGIIKIDRKNEAINWIVPAAK